MPDVSLLSITPADRNLLMRLTAEMLAVPFRVCGHRDCRRALACGYRRVRNGEPPRLLQLYPAEREAFDELFTLVLKIADALAIERPARNADARALEEAAIEIVLAARRTRPQLGFLFPPWLAKYRAADLATERMQAASNA